MIFGSKMSFSAPCYNKFSPVWWFKNGDEPVPPAWYRPDDKHRQAKR